MINYHYETGISMLNKIFIKFHRFGFSFSAKQLFINRFTKILRSNYLYLTYLCI